MSSLSQFEIYDSLVALDGSLAFTLERDDATSDFHISGHYQLDNGQRLVVGIEPGQIETPDGFTSSPAGFDYFYLGGGNGVQSFERAFRVSENVLAIKMFIKRWYTDSEIFVQVDQAKLDDGICVMGSCVSRDTFSYENDLILTGYRARFSFATLHRPPLPYPQEILQTNKSDFQRRMVQADLSKTAIRFAQLTGGRFILSDFIDERLEIRKTKTTEITVSPELLSTGLEVIGDTVDGMSEKYFEGFRSGWETFTQCVSHKTVIVNRAYWASYSEDGSLLADQKEIAAQNRKLSRIYEIVENHSNADIATIDYPPEILRSAPDHQWGMSPFHFGELFHEYQAHALRRIIG